MKKLKPILLALLAAQLLLTLLLFTFKTDNGAFQSDKNLLDLSVAAIDAISIEQKDQAPLTLKKEQDQWRLPGYFNVAVNSSKIADFTSKLLGQKTGWPVAKTEEAAERFQVNQDKFERKLVFQKDGKALKTLYLGTAPGFKKIHARVDGDTTIQAIEFSAFEASTTPEDWMQQDLLKLDPAQVSQIKAAGFSLLKADKDWTVEVIAANQSPNTSEIKLFVDKLLSLSYSAILGSEEKAAYHLKEPTLSFTLKQQAEEISYQFGKLDGSEDYVLKVSKQPYYFKVNKVLVDDLQAMTQKKLVIEKPAEASKDTKANSAPVTTDEKKS